MSDDWHAMKEMLRHASPLKGELLRHELNCVLEPYRVLAERIRAADPGETVSAGFTLGSPDLGVDPGRGDQAAIAFFRGSRFVLSHHVGPDNVSAAAQLDELLDQIQRLCAEGEQ